MALIAAREYSDRIAADVARLALEAEGIMGVLFDAETASLGLGSITAARLMVDADDLARAREILDALDA